MMVLAVEPDGIVGGVEDMGVVEVEGPEGVWVVLRVMVVVAVLTTGGEWVS